MFHFAVHQRQNLPCRYRSEWLNRMHRYVTAPQRMSEQTSKFSLRRSELLSSKQSYRRIGDINEPDLEVKWPTKAENAEELTIQIKASLIRVPTLASTLKASIRTKFSIAETDRFVLLFRIFWNQRLWFGALIASICSARSMCSRMPSVSLSQRRASDQQIGRI
jgi:hypothetical protein